MTPRALGDVARWGTLSITLQVGAFGYSAVFRRGFRVSSFQLRGPGVPTSPNRTNWCPGEHIVKPPGLDDGLTDQLHRARVVGWVV